MRSLLLASTALVVLLGATLPAHAGKIDDTRITFDRLSTLPRKEAVVMHPSTEAYMKAHETMSKGMKFGYTGDADIDFARGMIAHHQGAIDMAETELAYGKDKKIRAMAKNMIKNQTAEMKALQKWLDKKMPNPVEAAPTKMHHK